tara:strand:- start:3422 stop:4441 length:1020 start_codon:yes stop_codon:yes gene_type:complete
MRNLLFVTGGCGFIGSAFIRMVMAKTDFSIVNIDNLTYAANLDALSTVSDGDRYFFSKTDICSKEDISNLFNKYQPSGIINFAAETHVDNSINEPNIFLETNVNGTFNLLNCSLRYFKNLPDEKKLNFRFLHVSTDEVFGSILLDENKSFDENSRYDPNSPYSASKAASDHFVSAWNTTYGLPTLITNCSNNFGAFQHEEKLIPKIIKNALAQKSIPIYGDGSNIRDWIYVDDHVDGIFTVLNQGNVGQTYNIGSQNELSNISLVKKICKILDELVPNNSIESYANLIQFVDDRLGHDEKYSINPKKIYDELNWAPSVSFDKALRKTVSWYINHLNYEK